MSRELKDLVKGVLTGEVKMDSLSKQEFADVEEAVRLVKAKASKVKVEKNEHCGPEMMKYNSRGQWSMEKMEPLSKPPVSEAQRKAMHAAAKGKSNLDIPKSVGKDFAESDPGGKLPEKKMEKEEKVVTRVKTQMDSDIYRSRDKHNPDMESPKNLKKSWPGAQWSLEKAIKPGPALDYAKMNPKPNYAEIEAKAPVMTYDKNPMKAPKYTGAKERAEATRAKLEAESKETAMDTISRRQKMNKEEDEDEAKKNELMGYGTQNPAPMTMSEGVLIDEEPSEEDKKQMTAKGDLDLGP